MTKELIRDRIRTQKRAMNKEAIAIKSKQIREHLTQTKAYEQADCLYIYVSYNEEVTTSPIIEQAIKEGKQVAVPKVIGEEMEFYLIQSISELKPGYHKILEPVTKRRAIPQQNRAPLMILPGLAFDKEGGRIGYGGGFYDRYLSRYPKTFVKYALGFEFQLYDKLETEEFDVTVDTVITPEGVYPVGCLHNV